MTLQVVLPWPERVLSPNARCHWRRKHAATKSYKHAGWVLARHALQGGSLPAVGPISVKLTFYPPTNRRRDQDNLVASMKSGLDGIALGLQVDDSRFRLQPPEILPHTKGGKVVVTLECVVERECRRCKASKPLSEFRAGGFGRLWTCKSCQKKSGQGGQCIEPQRKVERT